MSANVDRRAATIASDVGSSSVRPGSPARRRMQAMVAKPQLGECVRCSNAGTSSSSQPSSWHSQLKHWTLSGLVLVGLHTNPAYARSCADGAVNGQAAFDFVPAFFDLLLVRLPLPVVAAPSKVARRAWYEASAASMVLTAVGVAGVACRIFLCSAQVIQVAPGLLCKTKCCWCGVVWRGMSGMRRKSRPWTRQVGHKHLVRQDGGHGYASNAFLRQQPRLRHPPSHFAEPQASTSAQDVSTPASIPDSLVSEVFSAV